MQNNRDIAGEHIIDSSILKEELALCVAQARKNEKDNPPKAILYAEKGLSLANKIGDQKTIIDLHTAKGHAHTLQGDFYQGIKSLSIGLELVLLHFPHDFYRITAIYNYLGVIYHDKHLQEVALSYFLKALSYKVEAFLPRLYNNLGSVFKMQGKLDEALTYLDKGMAMAQKRNDNSTFVFILDNIAEIYTKKKDYQFANAHLQHALKIIKEAPNEKLSFIHTAILHSAGTNCLRLKELDQAFDYLSQGLALCNQHSFYPLKSQFLATLGEVCLLQHKIEAFISYQREGIKLAKDQQLNTEEKNCLHLLRAYFEDTKNFKEAYRCSMRILAIEAEISTAKSDNNFAKVLDRREQEIFVLERKNTKIMQQNKELEQFAYIVAHDLKEPLRNINGFAKLLGRKCKGKLDTASDEYIGFIERNILHMHALLSDLLKYTSLEKSTLSKTKVNTQKLVTAILKNWQSQPATHSIDVKVGKLPMITANEGQMELVFKNLIHNAFKFKKATGPCTIEIRTTKDEEGLTFEIKDNGIGIEAAYHEKIFEIFKRLDKQYEGTGIGLALCDKIIRLHGGKIWLKSTPGKGSSFFFQIPNS